LIQGVALVLVSTRAALDRLDPDLEDAARLAGAAPSRTWWNLLWPILRPALAATGGLIFVTNLADPGAPLVLGLRRTMGFQIVTSALSIDPFPRIAAAGLIVLLCALAGGALALWPAAAKRAAGPDLVPAAGEATRSNDHRRRGRRDAAGVQALVWSSLLFVWSLLAWLPVAGLIRMSLQGGSRGVSLGKQARPPVTNLLHLLISDPAGRLLFHSVLLGASVFAVVALLARWPASVLRGPRFWSGERRLRRRSGSNLLIWSVPPLVVGVGMLALLRVVELAGRLLDANLGWRGVGASLLRLAIELQPMRTPGLLLVAGVCLAVLPRRLMNRREAADSEEASARQIDQAVLSGAEYGHAKSLALRGVRAIPPRTALLWATLAATSITPAILLAPSFASLPVGPGVVVLADQPESGRARASLLTLAAIGAQLSVLGWASARDRTGGEIEPADLA
jgi:iron(III) transport system permease protein